jgi:hypothetical protein
MLGHAHPGCRGFASGLITAAAVVGLATAAAGQEMLVERTVAVVGGAAITLSDVRTALALGLVDGDEREGVARLVERSLILHEVSRFAPPEPAAAEIEARVAALRARAGSPAAFDAILERGGLTVGRLAAWLRDDLRIAAYLDQRFVTAGTASEADVAEYAAAHSAELDAAGVVAADRLRVARERLQTERRRELITDWLAELRRRTPVVEIPG